MRMAMNRKPRESAELGAEDEEDVDEDFHFCVDGGGDRESGERRRERGAAGDETRGRGRRGERTGTEHIPQLHPIQYVTGLAGRGVAGGGGGGGQDEEEEEDIMTPFDDYQYGNL